MINGRDIRLRTVVNGYVVAYRDEGIDRERIFLRFDDLVQWLAEHCGELRTAHHWEPLDYKGHE